MLPIRTSHSFLDDIAHNAVPVIPPRACWSIDNDPAFGTMSIADRATPSRHRSRRRRGKHSNYDNELLDRHFITGDGRGNENIGLTTVHHIFHSEHNRQVDAQKLTILQSGDLAFVNEWLARGHRRLPR